MLSDEYRYRILKILESNPTVSQRELAIGLGMSLGKANYCLRALVATGLLKVSNFRNSKNKRAYMYYLTPKGIEEKARVTVDFLRVKMGEYESLKQEIELLRHEVAQARRQHAPAPDAGSHDTTAGTTKQDVAHG
jgi:EPS-associated MarR family transcriptional regulator